MRVGIERDTAMTVSCRDLDMAQVSESFFKETVFEDKGEEEGEEAK